MEKQIKMQCLFCKSDQFELPKEGYRPSCGEMIKCANCGKLNDYTSMRNITKEKATKIAKDEFQKIIKTSLKKL